MSRSAMAWAWTVQGLTPTQKLLLLQMADDYIEVRRYGISPQKRLAKIVNVSTDSIQRAIVGLEEKKLVKIRHRPGGLNTYNLPQYAVTPPQNAVGTHRKMRSINKTEEEEYNYTHPTTLGERSFPPREKQVQQERPPLPSWLDPAIWAAYCEHRKKLRRPMTPYAETQALRKLERLRSAGNDPSLVIQQSIDEVWQGLFELRRSNKRMTPEEMRRRFLENEND